MVKKNYEGSKVICEYDSSNLKSGEYDTVTKKLKITFNNGAVYEYDEVPHETFSEMNISESQGKYFNQNISRKFNYIRLL